MKRIWRQRSVRAISLHCLTPACWCHRAGMSATSASIAAPSSAGSRRSHEASPTPSRGSPPRCVRPYLYIWNYDLKHVSIYSNDVSLKFEDKNVYLLELKIEILLVSFNTNLILTLNTMHLHITLIGMTRLNGTYCTFCRPTVCDF